MQATTKPAPIDSDITFEQLTTDPYRIYKRLRAEAPIVQVKAVGRTFLTKAADTKMVKENPGLFSSADPNTPMERAYLAQTLMRRDGEDHLKLRNAMVPSFSAANIRDVWLPLYEKIAQEYISKLPRGQVVDFFPDLAGPVSARCLAHLLGIENATDEEMQRWSQTLIDGAGNYSWAPEYFVRSDVVNAEIEACVMAQMDRHKAEPNSSVLSVMANAAEPIDIADMMSNVKIAIGGGINEPRDALLTVLYGLLSNPEQKQAVLDQGTLWNASFEEAVRWVAPIQVSSRLVKEDTEIRGFHVPKGDVLMTIQASANHDEELYEDGHLFDIFRPKAPHQAFGNGPHFCLGTHIARRMTAGILLPMLFDRFPKMSIPDLDKVVWSGFGFRGPLNLPILLN